VLVALGPFQQRLEGDRPVVDPGLKVAEFGVARRHRRPDLGSEELLAPRS